MLQAENVIKFKVFASEPSSLDIEMQTARKFTICIVAMLCLVNLSSCAGDTPALEEKSVVGVWKSESGGANIVLHETGTFYVSNLPAFLLEGVEVQVKKVNGEGNWSLLAAISDPGGRQSEVGLNFTTINNEKASYATRLLFAKSDEGDYVYFTYDDPDLGRNYYFRRE